MGKDRLCVFLPGLLLAFAGCSGDDGQPGAPNGEAESSRSTQQAIVKGTTISTSSDRARSLINAPNGCSGVALDAEWSLTAKHCVDGGGISPPMADVTQVGVVNPGEQRPIREWFNSPIEDMSLLRVHRFSAAVPEVYPYSVSLSRLVGNFYACFGRGETVFDTGTGSGVWRTANLEVDSVVNTYRYRTKPNILGQTMAHGDSGGPCFDASNRIIGITQGGDATQTVHVGLTYSLTGWIEGIRRRSRLFFYDASNGAGWVAALEGSSTNTYTTQGAVSLGSAWTHAVTLRNGAILLYHSPTGGYGKARVNKSGGFLSYGAWQGGGWGALPAGMTHIAAVGPDRFFMYNASSGVGLTARLTSDGMHTIGEVIPGFSVGWTNVVGTTTGGLLFYNRWTGAAGLASVDGNLHYTGGPALSLSPGWTSVTSVNYEGVLFYNSSNATAFTARVSPAGYQADRAINPGNGSYSIGANYTSVVGASNGYLLFRDPWGGAVIAHVDGTGGFASLSNLSGFGTNWTAVSAE
ncbi:MAG TPA: trypsin-like serine protease [Labilithrix sp.]|nr:trypsin-like serine protease [Labilithrix sp.]